jgi:DNA-binding MarR family transcriptional regulator
MRTAPVPPVAERTSAAHRSLVLTDAAGELRRQLGPTAWTVLEELLLEADGSMHVETHVRRIAEGVGISKDCAARAVRRLIAQGVVTRRGRRDPDSGCFGRSVYVLRADAISGVLSYGAHETSTRVQAPRRERRPRALEDRQASLFDAPATGPA